MPDIHPHGGEENGVPEDTISSSSDNQIYSETIAILPHILDEMQRLEVRISRVEHEHFVKMYCQFSFNSSIFLLWQHGHACSIKMAL